MSRKTWKSFCSVTSFEILNNMRINKKPNDCISLYMVHSWQLYIDSLSCNENLCTGIKAKGPISFKTVAQLLTVINLKRYTSFIRKSFSIKSHFCLALLFSMETFLVQIISKTNQTSLCRSSNSLLNYFSLEKLISENSI